MQVREDEGLQRERFQLLLRQAPWGIAASVTCATILVFFLWSVASTWMMLLWWMVYCGFSAARLMTLRRRQTLDLSPPELKHARRRFIQGTVASGLLWAAAALLLYPQGSVVHQSFLALLIGGLGAGTVVTYSAYLQASLGFILTAFPVLPIQFFLQGDPLHRGMGLMGLLFVAVLVMTSFRMNRLIKSALQLGLDNTQLVQTLSVAKEQAEELNVELQMGIEERMRAEEALFQEKERLQVTLESIAEGVITTDMDGLIDYCNPVAEQMIGWASSEVRKRPFSSVFKLVDETSRKAISDPIAQCLAERRVVRATGYPLLVHPDGQEFSVELSVSPIRDRDQEIIGSILVFRDLTELRSLTRQMEYQAAHDLVTGLINRREFENRLQHALKQSQSEGSQHAVCYIDLDQFKVVNDDSGHVAGDELLKQLSAVLQEPLRESDTLARLGGDEFGVLLPGCSLSKAKEIAEKLRSRAEQFRFRWRRKVYQVKTSIGVVALTEETPTVAEVLGQADNACYLAKDLGRNRVYTLHPNDLNRAAGRGNLRWADRIQRGLKEEAFCLFGQKISRVGAGRGEYDFIEVLLRMIDGDQLVQPAAFMSTAERFEIMPKLDRWVLKNAFEVVARKNCYLDRPVRAGINLSAQSLDDGEFLDFTIEALHRHGLDPKVICFEISETAAISNFGRARRFITRLKALGCQFALDDFGSGMTLFNSLKHFDVDYLKIDGSFVAGMTQDSVDYAIVESVNQIGHMLGMQTIAEAVENEATLQSLHRLGVDYAQGYWIGRPQPLDQFELGSAISV